MKFYLAKKFFIHSLVFIPALIIVPYTFTGDLAYALPRSFFWGGLFAAGYTWYQFREKNLWPLYDNLRIPKYILLGVFYLSLQIVNLIILTQI